jgi:CRISPR-associated protein (TIGR03986 family)
MTDFGRIYEHDGRFYFAPIDGSRATRKVGGDLPRFAAERTLVRPSGTTVKAVDPETQEAFQAEEAVQAKLRREWQQQMEHHAEEPVWRVGDRSPSVDAEPLASPGRVYPFAMVALPSAAPEREPFVDHLRYYQGLLSGRIRLRLRLDSPMFTAGDNGDDPDVLRPLTIAGRYAIAGSSIKGLVRSTHEVMNASCLRVVDPVRPISHRVTEMAEAQRTPYRFELNVEHDDSGQQRVVPYLTPLEAYRLPVMCNAPHWGAFGEGTRAELQKTFGSTSLFHDLSDHVDGDEVIFSELVRVAHGEPIAHLDASGQSALRGWLKLSDVPQEGTKVHQRVLVRAAGDPVRVDEALVHRYNRLVAAAADADEKALAEAGASVGDDLVLLCDQDDPPDPRWGRRRPHHYLSHGDIVWSADPTTGFSPSQIHRCLPAVSTVGEAIPEEFAPCTSEDALCPSCRLFGMVAGDGDDDAHAVAGHVRPGPAWGPAVGDDVVETLHLPALMSPKPTHGPFYLKPQQRDRGSKVSNWDDDDVEIAGRKLYWHHDRPTARRDDAPAGLASTVSAVKKEQELTATLRFDNLDEATLGTLLVACDPRLLEGDFESARHKVGMGKPVGLGTTEVTVESVTLVDRNRRYRDLAYVGDDLSKEQQAQIVDAGRRTIEARLGSDARRVLSELAALLSPQTTSQRSVGYPEVPEGKGFTWFMGHRNEPLARPLQVARGRGQSR